MGARVDSCEIGYASSSLLQMGFLVSLQGKSV